MGDNTKLQYIVELLTQGDTSKARDEFDKLKTSAKGAGASVDALTTNAKTLFAALGGVALIHQSVEAFIEQEKAVAKLNAALKSTNQFTPELSKQMQDLSESMAETSLFADEAVLNVIAKLTALGAKKQDVERLTRATLDLATLMDGDLNQASRQMALAIGGAGAEAFDRLRLNIDKTLPPTEAFNAALLEIEKRAGGQAQAAIENLGGKIVLFKKQVEEAKEALGGFLAEAIQATVANPASNIGALSGRADKEQAVELLKNQYLALANAISLAVDNAHQLGKISFTAKEQMKSRLGGARELLGGISVGQTTSDEELSNIAEAILPQAGGLLRGVQQRMRMPGVPRAATAAAGPGAVSSPGLDEADLNAAFDAQEKMDDEIVKSLQEQFDLKQKITETADKQSIDAQNVSLDLFKQEKDVRSEILLAGLDGALKERAQIEINHQKRLDEIRSIKIENEDQIAHINELIDLENKYHDVQVAGFERANSLAARLNVNVTDLAAQGIQLFASGLAGAIVGAFEEGDKAFQKFASRFLRAIAEMILQALILKALQSLGGGGQVSSGGGAATMANAPQLAGAGGWFSHAIRAAGGVSDVSSPTYFPKFNVLAGEAGREVMTVLAQPRMVNFNGLSAQVGMAGSNRLAITGADALAARAGGGAGAGGTIDIRVTMSPGLKAEIVSSSVKGARLQVINDLHQDSDISRGVKGLTA